MIEIRELTASEAGLHLSALADLLLDCIAGGASVGFMSVLSKPDAEAYFQDVVQRVEQGDRTLLGAFFDQLLVGTVQIVTAMPPNQHHRADISKLLVLRSARAQGIGTQLMQRAEEVSRAAGRTLLVLDTATGGPAERLYTKLGWTRVGTIPNYALLPEGAPCATTIFYKEINR